MSARNGPMKENVYPTKLTWIRSAPIPARRVKPVQVSIYLTRKHRPTATDILSSAGSQLGRAMSG